MTIRWHPDTCKCIIDDMTIFVKRCKKHQSPKTINDVITHNKSFSVDQAKYNLPKVAWHIAKQKVELGETLTQAEIVLFQRKRKMLNDKIIEKAKTWKNY